MNSSELLNLARETAAHIAERVNLDTDAEVTRGIARIIAREMRPWIPDSFERDYTNRLIAAARKVAYQGVIDHDSYICMAGAGKELRAALLALDGLAMQRDQEDQERGEGEDEND
jgi:hypothetical protein